MHFRKALPVESQSSLWLLTKAGRRGSGLAELVKLRSFFLPPQIEVLKGSYPQSLVEVNLESWQLNEGLSPLQILLGKAISQLRGTRSSIAQPPPLYVFLIVPSLTDEHLYRQSKREVSSEWKLLFYHPQTFSSASMGSWAPFEI